MLKGFETVECVRSYAEEVAAQYVKRSLGLSHHYLRGKAVTAILCVKLPVDAGMAGFWCFVVDSGGQ
jgi:hypothetical protein